MSGFLFKNQGWLNLNTVKQKFSPLTTLSALIRANDDHMSIRSPSPEEVKAIKSVVLQTWNRNLVEEINVLMEPNNFILNSLDHAEVIQKVLQELKD